MKFDRFWKLRDRLLGLRDPAKQPSMFEMALTLAWLTVIALCVLIFWPSEVGTFIYEGF